MLTAIAITTIFWTIAIIKLEIEKRQTRNTEISAISTYQKVYNEAVKNNEIVLKTAMVFANDNGLTLTEVLNS